MAQWIYMYRRNLHKWMHEVRYSHPVMLNRAHSPFCHAERSEASMHWIPHCYIMTEKGARNFRACDIMTENGLADYRTIFGGYKL